MIGFCAALIILGVGAVGFFTRQPTPDLNARLDHARTVLDQARTTGTFENNTLFTALPLPDLEQANARKLLFIAKMLPQIVAENARILKQRARLKNDPSPAQLNALAISYGLKPETVSPTALLKRIDVLPISLVLAQAALESAWGTSRFARQGHAYFGERTFDPNAPGMVPKRASGFKVKSFRTPALSVRSYMRTLNTHRAYRALRERRAVLRNLNRAPSGADLAAHLKSYSEIGESYVTLILSTIRVNKLSDYDFVRHINKVH